MLNIKMCLKKFFQKKFTGDLPSDFEAKKFGLKRIDFRKKKAPVKAGADFLSLK